ncbi:MAG TPA: hypothetical protein VEH75_08875 [Xanthobacteraceae bacterium]|nr:hypothetical protein [Xanthobacteraceae bacterium]
MAVNEQHGERIAFDDVRAKQFGKLAAKESQGLFRIALVEGRGLVAEFEQRLMLAPVAAAERSAGDSHQFGLVIEMAFHHLFQAREKKWEFDDFAMCRAKPAFSDGDVIHIDHFMTEHISRLDQRIGRLRGHERPKVLRGCRAEEDSSNILRGDSRPLFDLDQKGRRQRLFGTFIRSRAGRDDRRFS